MVGPHPTPYPDVNEILAVLLTGVQERLRDQFVGLYLYGSLSSGDFDPHASDIDFLAVTAGLLTENAITELDAMHARLWKRGLQWAGKLEGSYLPAAHLRRYKKSGTVYPTVNEGRFYLAPHGSDWIIQRQVIREGGIVLAGPDPKSLIDPVSPEDIRHAVTGNLQEWWFPMLADPSWLKNHGSEYHAFAILTMCRSLYALQTGKVISKPQAARWASRELGGRWPQVIDQALAARAGQEDDELYEEALKLIRYTMEQMRSTEKK